jgi:hypothetical protein
MAYSSTNQPVPFLIGCAVAKQLKEDPITADDLTEYVRSSSSFAFELECLRLLKEIGWNCEHGGTYIDPVTKKPRQFDIRAHYNQGQISIRLAIECKAIKDFYPLLVFCTPRLKSESFHDIVYAFDSTLIEQTIAAHEVYATCFRLQDSRSIYHHGQPAGKNCAQVGRENDRHANLVGDDRELYEKWAQALSSGCELIERSCPADLDNDEQLVTFIQPMLVVPDGTLWQVNYNTFGAITDAPFQVDDVSFYVDHVHNGGDIYCPVKYSMSHLRIVTITGLDRACRKFIEDDIDIFPDHLTQLIKQFIKTDGG